jgi:hypothetical protein
MSLENAYTQIKRSPISVTFGSSSMMPEIQKDPTIMRLEQDVFSKLKELSPEESLQTQQSSVNVVRTLSPEEAIQQLLELEKAMHQPK